jgi:drug/metabolite transporter (DMT)-like permease
VLYTGIFSTAIAFTLQAVAQQHAPPADAAVILSMEAVFAALAGWLLLSERLNGLQLAGCGLILGGVLIVQVWPRKVVST